MRTNINNKNKFLAILVITTLFLSTAYAQIFARNVEDIPIFAGQEDLIFDVGAGMETQVGYNRINQY